MCSEMGLLFEEGRVRLQVKVKVKVKVTLRLMVSQSWCKAPSGAHDQIFITV
jgi:hypothetical protein